MATSPAFDPNREDTDETLAALSLRRGAVPWDSRPLLSAAESEGVARQQISERFTRSQAVQQIDAIRMPAPTLLADNRERPAEVPREAARTMPRESPTSYDTQDEAWLITPLAASSPPSHALKRSSSGGAPRVEMPALPTAAAKLAAAAAAQSETSRSTSIPIEPMVEAPQPVRVFGVSLLQLTAVSFFTAWVAVVLAMVVNTL